MPSIKSVGRHVKIFLWFWLGVLIVSGTLVSLTELSHSRAGTLRRLVRHGSRRRELHLRRGSRGSRPNGLFVPFNQVLTDGLSNAERTGLGLAITRRTFEVHGGTATAANAPDGGFIVTLELPLPA